MATHDVAGDRDDRFEPMNGYDAGDRLLFWTADSFGLSIDRVYRWTWFRALMTVAQWLNWRRIFSDARPNRVR